MPPVALDVLERMWRRLRSLFVPAVPVTSVLRARQADDPDAAILQLFEWERERLLTLAKGLGAAAVAVLAALIAQAIEGKASGPESVGYLAGGLVGILLWWSSFLLTGLHRLTEQYAIALELIR